MKKAKCTKKRLAFSRQTRHKIANHIRTQAKRLQQQAAAELVQAKQQVEQLILGE